ncbi:hypothetical protein T484DRAFT_1984840 [Baffinella frigidus]|nr:hypothetical protein T484DRAFT_1984840 [Cryptophyta sp. CCMP2293]
MQNRWILLLCAAFALSEGPSLAGALGLPRATSNPPTLRADLTPGLLGQAHLRSPLPRAWVTAAAEKGAEEGSAKLGTRERLEKYLKDRNIKLIDIPKALLLYELTSIGVMGAFWVGCYVLQPTRRGMVVATAAALAKGDKVTRGSNSLLAKRLATSYAEGFVARAALKPLIIPAKLFLTWKLQQTVSVLVGAFNAAKRAASGGAAAKSSLLSPIP